MKGLLTSIMALLCVQMSESYNVLRKQASESKHVHESRMLNSYVGGIEISGSNARYENYSPNEVPTVQAMNDAPDFLRSGDACLKNGSISTSNCPSPPNCNFNGLFGQAKLCINRLPTPQGDSWYVAAMVCIPIWENCDKCMCGKISSDTAGNAKCSFTGDTPDDDRVKVNCGQLNTASIDGVSISAPNNSNGSGTSTSQSTSSNSTQTKNGNANNSGSSGVNKSSSIAQNPTGGTAGTTAKTSAPTSAPNSSNGPGASTSKPNDSSGTQTKNGNANGSGVTNGTATSTPKGGKLRRNK